MSKFDKNTHCEYCEVEMVSKNRNKRFCSDKCRTYYNREQKQPTKKTKDLIKKEIKPINNYTPVKPNINQLRDIMNQPPSKNWLNKTQVEDDNDFDGFSDEARQINF